jgi:zinc transport system ATP-binding protein
MAPPLLSLDEVSFAYGREPVLDGVSLSVGPGEFVALVGPNGSGKSTLLRVLVGVLRPARGRVRLFDTEPTRLRDRGRLGYVPQRPSLAAGVAATVDDIVAAGRLTRAGWRRRLRAADRAADRAAVDDALAAVDLLDLRDRRVSELSGGQQQRAFIARALAGQPELLVLDEPVAGVDVESQQVFRRSLAAMVRDRGGSVLLVSHELSAVADDLDRIVVLKHSVRFDGTPRQLADRGVHLGIHERDLPLWLEGIS